MKFGLLDLRMRLGLSLQEIAPFLQTVKSVLSMAENLERKLPEKSEKILQGLGAQVEALLNEQRSVYPELLEQEMKLRESPRYLSLLLKKKSNLLDLVERYNKVKQKHTDAKERSTWLHKLVPTESGAAGAAQQHDINYWIQANKSTRMSNDIDKQIDLKMKIDGLRAEIAALEAWLAGE